MALLYPPILENKLQSFSAATPDEQKSLVIQFEMPGFNDVSAIGHA